MEWIWNQVYRTCELQRSFAFNESKHLIDIRAFEINFAHKDMFDFGNWWFSGAQYSD